MSDWFYQRDGNVVGPISKQQIDYLKSVGRITDGQLVREGNRGDWIPVRINRQRSGAAGTSKAGASQAAGVQAAVVQAGAAQPAVSQAQATPVAESQESRKVPPAVPSQESADRRVQRQMVIAVLLLLLLLLLLWWFWPTASQPTGTGSDSSGDGLQSEGDGRGQESTDGDGATGSADQGDSTSDDASQATDSTAVNSSASTDAASDGTTGSPTADGDPSTSSQPATAEGTMDSTSTQPVPKKDDPDSQLATNGAALSGSGDSPFTITAPGEATFFGLNATGRTFVFVVDCSGSMAGAPLQRAKDELMNCVRSLPSRVEVKVVFFSSVSRPDPEGYRKLSRRNVDGLEKWVSSIQEGGGTEVILGMNDAFSGSKKPDGIFLLTDGEFDVTTPAMIQQLNPNGKTRINTIALISRSGESLLKQIAKENRGDYRFVP